MKFSFSKANGTVEFYIFETDINGIGATPGPTYAEPQSLDAFVEANPQTVGLIALIDPQTTNIDFVPTRTAQITIIASNRSTNFVSFGATEITLLQPTPQKRGAT